MFYIKTPYPTMLIFSPFPPMKTGAPPSVCNPSTARGPLLFIPRPCMCHRRQYRQKRALIAPSLCRAIGRWKALASINIPMYAIPSPMIRPMCPPSMKRACMRAHFASPKSNEPCASFSILRAWTPAFTSISMASMWATAKCRIQRANLKSPPSSKRVKIISPSWYSNGVMAPI